MLVLTRKSQQDIIINKHIRVSILNIDGNRVKIGVTAATHIDICRNESTAISSNDNSERLSKRANAAGSGDHVRI